MALKNISSPGVQISEVDATGGASFAGGTSVLIPGFASQGPVDEVFAVGSMGEFELIYGKPTNSAERYFYQTAKAVFNSASTVLTTRLPYGSGSGLGVSDKYTALFYPVFPYRSTDGANVGGSNETVSISVSGGAAGTAGVSLSSSGVSTYLLGKPQLVELTRTQYQDLQQGNYTWSDSVRFNYKFTSDSSTWGQAGMIVTNTSRTAINDKYEGYYVAIADNTQLNPATNFTSVKKHFTVNEQSQDLTLEVPVARRNFTLSGTPTSNDDSVSEVLEGIASFDISGNEFKDTLTLGLFKLKTSIFSTDVLKLDYVLAESYLGSLDAWRKLQNPAGGNPLTFFLGDVEDGSPNIEVFVNQHLSYSTGTWMDSAGNTPLKSVRVLTDQLYTDSSNVSLSGNGGVSKAALDDLRRQTNNWGGGAVGFTTDTTSVSGADALIPLGTYQKSNPTTKEIGSVPEKLERLFRTIDNVDLVNIDISVEAGLGTIYTGAQWNQTYGPANFRGDTFDDEITVNIGAIDHENDDNTTGFYQISDDATFAAEQLAIRDNYRAVFNKFDDFAQFNRKDHLHIADAPRYLFVQGINQKIMEDKRNTFTQAVYWPLRHVYGHANSSYSTVFGNWGKCYESSTDKMMWCPFSGYAAGAMSNNDASFGPWYAPAGFTRGRFGGLIDLAVIPSQKHRDQLYRINVNPVTQFPGEGMVIFGQKTFFRKPSAFDRLNVRRLFLYLEKMVRNIMKYYVFEPNTLLTRTAVLNELTPRFENIRVNQGMYDFLIVCDDRNNTPTTIDANELVVDIYVKPVRAAEIILVNFYATRTGQDFSEIVS